MPLCFTLIRSALHSWHASHPFPHAPRTPYSRQWHTTHNIHFWRRSYITAIAERLHDGPSAVASADGADATYLDLLAGEDDRNSRSSDQLRHGTESPLTNAWLGSNDGIKSVRPTLPLSKLRRARKSATQRAQARAVERTTHRRQPQEATLHLVKSELRTTALLSPSWNVRYASLARRFDSGLPEHFLEPPTALLMSTDAFERIDEVLDHMESMPDGSVWSLTTFAHRHGKLEREIWAETALWLVCYDKVRLVRFLLATHIMLYPPINWVEDCLRVLARHYITSSKLDDEMRATRFRGLVRTLLVLIERETKEPFVLSSSFVLLVMPYCTDAQLDEIWARIKLGKVKVHSHTILHFAEHFVKHGQLDRSLDALLDAEAMGARMDSVAFHSACATLLRRSSSHPGGIRMCLRLVEHLGSLGLVIDTRIYSIVMLNAVEAGDLETVSNLYRAMLDQGHQPNEYTFAIRLKACKLQIRNSRMLQEVITDAIKYVDVRTNILVCGEILHCLALHHVKYHRGAAFNTLAVAYTQFFDPAPLERLGIELPPGPKEEADSPQQRMQPSRQVLTNMLWVYLRHKQLPKDTIDCYKRWRQLVASGDKAWAECATAPYVSNVFLHRFTRQQETLLQATQVIKDMQNPLPPTSGIKQAPPNLVSWTIFMRGFVRQGQTKLAEQVLSYMRSKGMEPDHVTWNYLIGRYADDQDAEGLVDVVRRAEAGDEVWNYWAHRRIKNFRDKERLGRLLEEQKFEQRMDFSQDIKKGLSERLMEAAAGEGRQMDEEWSGAPKKASKKRPPKDVEGFADSSSELAEMAGSFRQV
ncbi:hypothetical protein LTR91_002166 [Friedmanniomyces endolithicus]|uniref:Pentacotripeptide-repeat region of PRORP domain-containing protein n=1 Tax=Friedmanniomyces endolithicus TaxID=329885 RepID=A0AAN6KYY3_9PEZI|nr:hypothetical protein LTR57_003969 [Friedmanniomyces endolithicus]KAK0975672.1 hypothetical protein LTS01_013766 [Friedmanniomyces endolithicus]KAK1011694.1 hypothetical protein LTR91_002166 [Friedmanniomyces endolithicus]